MVPEMASGKALAWDGATVRHWARRQDSESAEEWASETALGSVLEMEGAMVVAMAVAWGGPMASAMELATAPVLGS
jgi:uridine phosphorylase